jgi:hypothetical protein
MLDGAEGDDDGVTGAALTSREPAACAVVPAACVVHDGSDAATALPAPSTRIPPVSATATSFGLIMAFLTIGLLRHRYAL